MLLQHSSTTALALQRAPQLAGQWCPRALPHASHLSAPAGQFHPCGRTARTILMASSSSAASTSTWHLPDAHSHPQDDMQHAQHVASMHSTCVAVMGVREGDWQHVLDMQRAAPSKVIPCFGVHPWFAHLHSSEDLPEPGSSCTTQAAEGSSTSSERLPDSQGNHLKASSCNSCDTSNNIAAQLECSKQPSHASSNHDRLLSACLPLLEVPANQDRGALQEALAASVTRVAGDAAGMPSTTWAARLEALLQEHPHAVVGECGLDRAAVILGSKAQPSVAHQVALVRHHLRLAAHWGRPISMHCVRATGPMQDLLQSVPPEQLPQRIMLHSFGGPPDSVKQLVKLAGGVGRRLWFSFSTAINASKGEGARDKLVARVCAVPDDRLLIETDQNTALRIDEGLEAMLQVVADAKGWSHAQAAERMVANFEAFYDGFLPPGYTRQ